MEQKAARGQWRSFGLIVGGAFALVGAWPAVRSGQAPKIWSLALSGSLIAAALVYPPILRYPYDYWMRLGRALGWINTRILLSVLFYLIFTPIGVIRRWLGKDPMRRAFEPDAASYRQVRSPRPGSHMKRQF
ncbi:MAG TPA: SxtJ family membrane protein [Candidatus Cryosericum sp.]|nr:SxtJ family membrane protein [Candidatus Cryosericum sp.]